MEYRIFYRKDGETMVTDITAKSDRGARLYVSRSLKSDAAKIYDTSEWRLVPYFGNHVKK